VARDNAINAADLREREAKYFLSAGWTRFLKTYPTGKSVPKRETINFFVGVPNNAHESSFKNSRYGSEADSARQSNCGIAHCFVPAIILLAVIAVCFVILHILAITILTSATRSDAGAAPEPPGLSSGD
jgi:hypothetical protein